MVQNPATSSPGLAFLLATVAYFGEDGWADYWAALRENDVTVTRGWEEAYYGQLLVAAPVRASVPSSSPTLRAPRPRCSTGPTPGRRSRPRLRIESGCFRQVEFAGILTGTPQPELAGALIDHLLSPEVQAEFPLAMFVYPARSDVALPDAFVQHALVPASPLSLDPDVIDANREAWISEWTDIVLR